MALSDVFEDRRVLAGMVVLEVLYERASAGGPVGRAALAELDVRAPGVAEQVRVNRREARDAAMARMVMWDTGLVPRTPGSIFDVTVA